MGNNQNFVERLSLIPNLVQGLHKKRKKEAKLWLGVSENFSAVIYDAIEFKLSRSKQRFLLKWNLETLNLSRIIKLKPNRISKLNDN